MPLRVFVIFPELLPVIGDVRDILSVAIAKTLILEFITNNIACLDRYGKGRSPG